MIYKCWITFIMFLLMLNQGICFFLHSSSSISLGTVLCLGKIWNNYGNTSPNIVTIMIHLFPSHFLYFPLRAQSFFSVKKQIVIISTYSVPSSSPYFFGKQWIVCGKRPKHGLLKVFSSFLFPTSSHCTPNYSFVLFSL